MEILFYGICTHLDASVTGEVHRVALPASSGYSVFDPDSGTTLQIPDHTPMLAIRSGDIVEGDVDAFAGNDLHPLPAPDGDLAWSLDTVIFSFDGLGEHPLRTSLRCLPHLTDISGAQLRPLISAGLELSSVSAYIDVGHGSLEVIRDSGDAEGRHVRLLGEFETPWHIHVRTPDGPLRSLEMAPNARVTFSNFSPDNDSPCSVNDYLLHYRLTLKPYVPPEDFLLPGDCDPVPLDFTMFPAMHLKGAVSTTLSNFSNTVYP
jgi:hypothetical protein